MNGLSCGLGREGLYAALGTHQGDSTQGLFFPKLERELVMGII